jgi:hypothetical protein
MAQIEVFKATPLSGWLACSPCLDGVSRGAAPPAGNACRKTSAFRKKPPLVRNGYGRIVVVEAWVGRRAEGSGRPGGEVHGDTAPLLPVQAAGETGFKSEPTNTKHTTPVLVFASGGQQSSTVGTGRRCDLSRKVARRRGTGHRGSRGGLRERGKPIHDCGRSIRRPLPEHGASRS